MVPSPSLRRRYWREAVLVLVVCLPGLVLLPPGVVWLYQQGWLLEWSAGGLLAGGVAFWLRRAIARSVRDDSEKLAALASPPSPGWGERDLAAWGLVEAKAAGTPALSPSPTLWEDAMVLMRETVDLVAAHYHPGVERARYRLTLPEALLLTERVSRDLRAACLRHVPASQHVQIATLLKARDLYDAHGETVKTLYSVARAARTATSVVTNPVSAVLREAGGLLAGRLVDDLTLRLQGQVTQMLIRETGRAAIDLYSGRLRLSDAEVRQRAEDEALAATPDLTHPVRVVLTGQVSAGKSTLLNALAETVQRRTGVSPSREGTGTLRLDRPGKPRLVMVDLPGLGFDGRGETALAAEAGRADLILWVVSAIEPARAADLAALATLRQGQAGTVPPIRLVLTHVDHLRPRREWAPPYGEDGDSRPKARAIAEARTTIAAAFGLSEAQSLPVAVVPEGADWNIGALWDLIASSQPAARHHQLDRLNRDAGRVSVRRTLRQTADGAGWLWRTVRGKAEKDPL